MNNKILKIMVFILLCMPWLDHARVMSPGVAQAELNRMIRDAKRNPPSEQKMKQLLNDISPSLKEEYQDLLNEVNSKKISAKEKKEEIINVTVALALLKEQIEEVKLKEDALKLMEVLASEENFRFDEHTAREFTALAKDLIETKFSEKEIEEEGLEEIIENDEKGLGSDDTSLIKNNEEIEQIIKNDNVMKEQQEKLLKQEELREQGQEKNKISNKDLSTFISSLHKYFEKYLGELNSKKIIVLNFDTAQDAPQISDINKQFTNIKNNFQSFIKGFKLYQKQTSYDMKTVKIGFQAFFNAVSSLFTKIGDSDMTCDVLKNFSAIMTKANDILNSQVHYSFSKGGTIQLKNNLKFAGDDADESLKKKYEEFINQMKFIKEMTNKACNIK